MKKIPPRGAAIPWRLLVSPLGFAVAAAFALALHMLGETARILVQAHRVSVRVDFATARRAAEAAAFAALRPRDVDVDRSLGVHTNVTSLGATLLVESRPTAGANHWFSADALTGAGPAALAPLPSPQVMVAGSTPRVGLDRPILDAQAVAVAPRADTTPLLRREPGIALLRVAVGTDADDFVLQGGLDRRQLTGVRDLMLVPGNLWLEQGATPCELPLPEDLVLVVAGNLYLQRSLRVTGSGRLLIVTMVPDDATAFADEDFNGRRANSEPLLGRDRFVGRIEGAGSMFLGGARGASIECQAGLVVSGILHLVGDARVNGPLVVAGRIVGRQGSETVVAAGEWGFEVARERVPGFLTEGPARPGRLRYLGQGTSAAMMRQETLYASSPGR